MMMTLGGPSRRSDNFAECSFTEGELEEVEEDSLKGLADEQCELQELQVAEPTHVFQYCLNKSTRSYSAESS